MPVASIVIKANPVTAWERFATTLVRGQFQRARFTHRDIGGDWAASFEFHPDQVTRELAQDFLANGLMREVRIYNEKGVRDWTGVVWAVRYDLGVAAQEVDLGDLANRVWVRYNSGGTSTRSTTLNNTDSQDRIGIIERVLVGGPISLATADAYAQRVLDWVSWPSPGLREANPTGAVKRPTLQIRCRGYWHTLGFRTYTQTVLTGDADASTVVQAIVDDVGEFIRTTDVDTNTTQVPQEYDTDRYGDKAIIAIAEMGDGAFHKWVTGVTGDRDFYYRQAARPER